MKEVDVKCLDPFDFRLWNQIIGEIDKNKEGGTCNWTPFLDHYDSVFSSTPIGKTKLYTSEQLAAMVRDFYGGGQATLVDLQNWYGGSIAGIRNAVRNHLLRFVLEVQKSLLPYPCNRYDVYSEEPIQGIRFVEYYHIHAQFCATRVFARSTAEAIETVHRYCPDALSFHLKVVMIEQVIKEELSDRITFI